MSTQLRCGPCAGRPLVCSLPLVVRRSAFSSFLHSALCASVWGAAGAQRWPLSDRAQGRVCSAACPDSGVTRFRQGAWRCHAVSLCTRVRFCARVGLHVRVLVWGGVSVRACAPPHTGVLEPLLRRRRGLQSRTRYAALHGRPWHTRSGRTPSSPVH